MFKCDEIVTRIAKRDSVCVVEGENHCGVRARNCITGAGQDHLPRDTGRGNPWLSARRTFSPRPASILVGSAKEYW